MPTEAQQPDATDYLTVLKSQFPPVAGATVDLVPVVWRIYGHAASRGGQQLQYQYARRDLLDGLLNGQYATAIKYTEADVTEDLTALFKNLSDIRALAHAEVLRLEQIARNSRGCVVGQMVTTSPLTTDNACQFDPNGRSTRGDALRRGPFRP